MPHGVLVSGIGQMVGERKPFSGGEILHGLNPGKSLDTSKEWIPFQGLQARVPGHFNWYPQDRAE
ncbi:MAG TPA: hypothetical protein VKB61_13845, partial [Candidatus Acidoferrum sp.]|nr:hypothetical protein [Candidatus Acidoferrum sp.]